MVQLKTNRTALLLYALLLVLPTVVLGTLQWYQMVIEQELEAQGLPRAAEDARRRLIENMRGRLARLLEEEDRRPFEEFAPLYLPETPESSSPRLEPSPLTSAAPPAGILAWFCYDTLDESTLPRLELFTKAPQQDQATQAGRIEELRAVSANILRRNLEESWLRRSARLGGIETREVDLGALAVSRARGAQLGELESCWSWARGQSALIEQSQFHLQFYLEADGTPRPYATRRVIFLEGLAADAPGASCLDPIREGMSLVQGVLLDPEWIFGVLPAQAAQQALNPNSEFLLPMRDAAQHVGHAALNVVREMGFETELPEELDFGLLKVVIDSESIEERHSAQRMRFLALGAMLVLSLFTGIVFLVRSVRRDLEQVQRTENFVAAITHELRTPVSTIKLHGEMLEEGWVTDPAQQQEYYRRIVRETARLSTLVERVLEKARLSAGSQRALPTDLNHEIELLRASLESQAKDPGAPLDLCFELAPDLPLVMLTSEALLGILTNLVENARKYAPVDTLVPGFEPLVVRTRMLAGKVLLEVADRGPGIPPEQRERVFEAFYRIGNEGTRRAAGTGLGLHLVWLHARSVGGQASVHAREGGGSLFRIAFASAPEHPPAG